jgi:hypothetical protein
MAQTLAQYGASIRDSQGRPYRAKACGRQRDDRLWEGWLEFEREGTGDVLRSARETTQPNLQDLEYWATGLTSVYLEGALARILNVSPARPAEPHVTPRFDGPAEHRGPAQFTAPDAILDPFSVYDKSPDLLAQELTALRARHLRKIIKDYGLADDSDQPLEGLTEPELGSLIMQRVRERHA